jgi:hypothetical protein
LCVPVYNSKYNSAFSVDTIEIVKKILRI